MDRRPNFVRTGFIGLAIAGLAVLLVFLPAAVPQSTPEAARTTLRSALFQSQAEADRKSTGCFSCHGPTEASSMHAGSAVRLGCTDCHGGRVEVQRPAGAAP